MTNQNQKLIQKCIEKGILVSPEFLNHIKDKNIFQDIDKIDWQEFEKTKNQFQEEQKTKVHVLSSFNINPKSYKVQDFVKHLMYRFRLIERILRQRQEMQSVISISRILQKKEKENVSIIGMVQEVSETKNGNLIVTLQDQTGEIKAIISKDKTKIFAEAKNLVPDEVIGIQGTSNKEVIYTNKIIWPDIPLNKEVKHAKEECYAIFLSDIHIGSRYFLEKEFNQFLTWIRQEAGSEAQKKLASKIKYLFVCGDIVDGVGIYPSQEKELTINDIYKQYEECAKFFSKIPKHIKIIISPGNHDSLRLAEPQPPIPIKYAKPLYDLENVTMVTNPALVRIHASEEFEGFDVLMYHGMSYDHYIANVDELRNSGGYERVDIVMKFLLKRRHLAPTHSYALYIPDDKSDALTINKIPDIFVSGHVHKSIASNYRNISLICGSCWQAKTSFQEKVGHEPEPARVPMINLKTREIKILRFM